MKEPQVRIRNRRINGVECIDRVIPELPSRSGDSAPCGEMTVEREPEIVRARVATSTSTAEEGPKITRK